MDIKKVKQAIDAISVCSDAKNQITQLVEEITGKKLRPNNLFQTGKFYKHRSSSVLYFCGNAYNRNNHVILVNLTTGTKWTELQPIEELTAHCGDEFDEVQVSIEEA